MQTQKMQDFIAKNKLVKIVFGERLTPEGNPVITGEDLKRSDRVLYRFTDGVKVTLLFSDTRSAPKFKPIWDLGKKDQRKS